MPKRHQPGLPFVDPLTPGPLDTGSDNAAPASRIDAGRGDPLLGQVADLCAQWPSRAKWLIVPRHALGLAFADRLARRTGGWANLHVVTPLDLAIRMAAPLLLDRGITPGEESLGPALVMRLRAEIDVRPGYFRGMADQPSLASALWRTIRELRLSGVSPPSLPAYAFVSADKHAELVALLTAYKRWLEAERIADAATVFAHAPAGARYCPLGAADVRIEWPLVVWDPIVKAFLDGLPGERIDGRVVATAGRSREGRAASYASRSQDVAPPAASAASRLRYLRVPAEAPENPAGDDTLEIFHAGGRHAELDEVARRVLALGRSLDDIEIACTTDDHVWLAWEKCVRLGWKVTVSAGLPVLTTAPGRALVGWCDWVESNFSGSAMRRLLLSGAVTPRAWASEEGDARVSSTRAARLLADAAPSWGRDTWAASLGTFAAQEEQRAADTTDDESRKAWRLARARDARTLGAWVRDLLEALPGDAQPATLGATLAAARAFLAENAAVRNPVDGVARSALVEMLSGFDPIADHAWPVAEALRLVREQASALRAGRDRARPGHLHVSTLDDAGADGRPFVFVVGLEEGRVFPGAREDPILLDRERAAINAALGQPAHLRSSADRQIETIDGRLARLAAIGAGADRVVLSYSCRDTREFRDTFASWVVLNAFRVKTGDAGASYRTLHDALGELPASPVPASPAAAITTAEWWLSQGRRARDARAATLETYPHLERGLVALRARSSDDFTVFDGLVKDAASLDPSRTGRFTSVSMLERLAGCPFRFFLEHGLGVNELEESEPNPDAWLDGGTRGTGLHAVYATLMRRARDRGRRVTAKEDLAWARDEARAALERLRREMPPPSDVVFERESDEFLDDVELFVADEEAKTEVEPVGFEIAFGPGAGDEEPLNDARPLDVQLTSTRVLRMRGRIDRVDRLPDGSYQVVDYKTGYYRKDDYDGEFAMGTRMQPMVYGLAAEYLLAKQDPGARVTCGTYAFPTSRGFRTVKSMPLPDASTTRHVIGLTLDVVAAGTFPTAAKAGTCRYCPLGRACGEARDEDTERKLAATPLAAFRQLREVK